MKKNYLYRGAGYILTPRLHLHLLRVAHPILRNPETGKRWQMHLWNGVRSDMECANPVVVASVHYWKTPSLLDWLHVQGPHRREGLATEAVRALLEWYGPLNASWLTESGAAFGATVGFGFVCPPEERAAPGLDDPSPQPSPQRGEGAESGPDLPSASSASSAVNPSHEGEA